MYRIEQGKTGFSAKVLYDLSNALNVSCDYILKGSENEEITTLNEVIRRFDNSQQMAIERMLIEIGQIKEHS